MSNNKSSGKTNFIGSHVCALGTDGLYYSGVIIDLKTQYKRRKPQKPLYLIKFESENNENIPNTSYYSHDKIIGPGFNSLKNIKLSRGQIVYCTHNKREISAKVHFHNCNKNNLELVINVKNKEIVVCKNIEEVRLTKSIETDCLVDSIVTDVKLSDDLKNIKKRKNSITDLNTFKSIKKFKNQNDNFDDDNDNPSKPLIKKFAKDNELFVSSEPFDVNSSSSNSETFSSMSSNISNLSNKESASNNMNLPIKVIRKKNFEDDKINYSSLENNFSNLLKKSQQNKLSSINLENFSIIHSPIESKQTIQTVLTANNENKKFSLNENKLICQTPKFKETEFVDCDGNSNGDKTPKDHELLKSQDNEKINKKNDCGECNRKNSKEVYSVTLKRITPKVLFQCGLKGLDGELCGQIRVEYRDLEEHMRKDHVENVIEHIQKLALKRANKEPEIIQFPEIPHARPQDHEYSKSKNPALENFPEFQQSSEQSDFVITNAFSLTKDNINDASALRLPISTNQIYLEEVSKLLGSDVISLNLDIQDDDKKTIQKCRRFYGKLLKQNWCNQCKWKKACTRFGNQNEEENSEEQENTEQNKNTECEDNEGKQKEIELNNKVVENLSQDISIEKNSKETNFTGETLEDNNLENEILNTKNLNESSQIIIQNSFDLENLLNNPNTFLIIN